MNSKLGFVILLLTLLIVGHTTATIAATTPENVTMALLSEKAVENGNGSTVVLDQPGNGTITHNGTTDLTAASSQRDQIPGPAIRSCGSKECCKDEDCHPTCGTQSSCQLAYPVWLCGKLPILNRGRGSCSKN